MNNLFADGAGWLSEEYPLLWKRAGQADHDERMGGRVDPFDAQCLATLYEIWQARRTVRDLKERLRLAADVVEKLSEQQAMPDDWYLGPLALIKEAGK